jgi:hypothetical protein
MARHGRYRSHGKWCSCSPGTSLPLGTVATSPSTSTAGRFGAGRVERTEPIGFGSEYTDVGPDAESPVTDGNPLADNAFTGAIKWIEMEGGQDSHDHLVDAGHIFHYAMAKQWRAHCR